MLTPVDTLSAVVSGCNSLLEPPTDTPAKVTIDCNTKNKKNDPPDVYDDDDNYVVDYFPQQDRQPVELILPGHLP